MNNPMRFIDPDGMDSEEAGGGEEGGGEGYSGDAGPESTHVDAYGTIIKSYIDGDNSVYLHTPGTTAQQLDDQFMSAGRGGTKIGELGGTINVNSILGSLLSYDGMIANDMTPSQWVDKVLPGSNWDLKDRPETIFGAAWKFDADNKANYNDVEHHTFFRYKDF